MFNADFFPTPQTVIDRMLTGIDLNGKTILEPSAGSGSIVDAIIQAGGTPIACELNDKLRTIVASKCKVLAADFMTVTSEQVSHIHTIVMNPPFSADEKHILHAYEIAPAGCTIIALCNLRTIKNPYTKSRENLCDLIESFGDYEDIGRPFEDAERTTSADIALIRLQKPAAESGAEFNGFFMDEEPEQQQFNGIMPYNAVRDLVNRYVAAIKIFDKQLDAATQMNTLCKGFFSSDIALSIHVDNQAKTRNEVKKDLQRSGWKWIFSKLNMERTATRSLREDLNKFVEEQTQIPFTMRNIYAMLEIIAGTTEQRMDKAILQVFEKITGYADENKTGEGWKTNNHYLLNKKFIIPRMCEIGRYHSGNHLCNSYGANFDFMEDMVKAICYITGEDWNKYGSLANHCRYNFRLYTANSVEYFSDDIHYRGMNQRSIELQKQGIPHTTESGRPIYGDAFTWAFFKIKAYKKGTMHFEFVDEDIWAKFNQRVGKLKGYPLPKQTARPKQQHDKKAQSYAEPEILFTI
jgi:hypothetical protein